MVCVDIQGGIEEYYYVSVCEYDMRRKYLTLKEKEEVGKMTVGKRRGGMRKQ